MPLMPKRVKFRKTHRGRVRGLAHRGNRVDFGEFGLQTLDRGCITAQQIEAARVAMSRALGSAGKYWIRVFPFKSYTAKPAETRQGKGKGDVAFWGCPVRPGQVLFEIGGVNADLAKQAFRLQSAKLPVRVKMIMREGLR
jgi:large subunit ribosomal protein L16